MEGTRGEFQPFSKKDTFGRKRIMPAQLQHEVRNSPLEIMLNVEVHAFYRHK